MRAAGARACRATRAVRRFCKAADPEAAVAPFARAAATAHAAGLGVNAGHDLNLDNLAHFAASVPHLEEVSIGHALISDALYLGLQNAVGQYKEALRPRS